MTCKKEDSFTESLIISIIIILIGTENRPSEIKQEDISSYPGDMRLVFPSCCVVLLTLVSIQLAAPQECPRLLMKAKVRSNAKRSILLSKAKVKITVTLGTRDPVHNLDFMLTLPNGLSVEKTASGPSSKFNAPAKISESLDGTTNVYWPTIQLGKNRMRLFRAKVKVDECAPETLNVGALAYFSNATSVSCMTRLPSPAQVKVRYSKLKRKIRCAPTPAPSINPAQPFLLFARQQRFSQGSRPAPFEDRRRSLPSGLHNKSGFLSAMDSEVWKRQRISTPKDCYEYCSLKGNELVPFFFNWNTATNECFCCTDMCTPFIFDPRYDMFEVNVAATAVPTSAPTIFTPSPTPSILVMVPTPGGREVVVRIGNSAEDSTSGSIQFANVISPGITVSQLMIMTCR